MLLVEGLVVGIREAWLVEQLPLHEVGGPIDVRRDAVDRDHSGVATQIEAEGRVQDGTVRGGSDDDGVLDAPVLQELVQVGVEELVR